MQICVGMMRVRMSQLNDDDDDDGLDWTPPISFELAPFITSLTSFTHTHSLYTTTTTTILQQLYEVRRMIHEYTYISMLYEFDCV